MAAQLGGSVLLQYGPQVAQQVGSSVLLEYSTAIITPTISVRATTRNPWSRANRALRPLNSPTPATLREDQSRKAPWVTSVDLDNEDVLPFVASARTDTGRRAPWSDVGVSLDEDQFSRWKASARTDAARRALWGAFGEMLNEDQRSRWKASAKRDANREGEWGGFWVPQYRPVDYERVAGDACDFAVVGGKAFEIMLAESTAFDPKFWLAFQLGPLNYAPVFTGDPFRGHKYPLPGATNFTIGKEVRTELLVDQDGQPILRPMATDPTRINPWGLSKKTDDETIIPWIKFSRPLNPGWGVVTPPGPPTPQPGQSIIIPVQRVYIVLNEVMLLRVDGMTPIPATQMSVNFDCDSWLPSFSATIPESAREAVMPDPSPVEVEIAINGIPFRFFVERITRNRAFAQNTVTIGGRGIACELDAPYAEASQHINATEKTAQQLIGTALEYTDYTQTWNITDWLVPANTFSLYGTPAQVAGNVAEAAGAVLQADWSLRDLRMLPRYPVKPWEWSTATPEYVIPAAVAQSESLEWVEKPAYNVVYVSGVQTGVLGQVKITGTAGDKPAPMITHPLITHTDAARQRGISVLSDTGRKAMMQISLPVLDTLGVIDVCRLIEFHDGTSTRRGIVRANSISVNFPTVRQTLTIEAAA